MKQTFLASLAQLHAMLQFILQQAQESQANTEALRKIELACEEALVNIVSYSYPQHSGNVEIQCEGNPQSFKVIIQDLGIPYNPLACLRTPEERKGRELTIGGYGIFLMLQMMDEVDYKRQENRNRLTLTKYY